MDNEGFSEKLQKEYEKVRNNIKKPNILLAGATGVGKSSLVNMIFGKELAVTGIGKPVTQDIDVFETEDTSVRLFDSKGYELGSKGEEDFNKYVLGKTKQEIPLEERIHLIWYCISCSGNRVTDYDLKSIKTFKESKTPVAIVFTKADLVSDEEMESLRKAIPDEYKDSIFETTNEKPEYNQTDKLVDWSIEKLPESLKDGFISTQKISLKQKWNKAHILIAEHTAAAFAVGFTPIPMSDAPILICNELTLLARILHLYNLNAIKEILGAAGVSTILGPLLTSGGKALLGTILKLIPGVGSVVGGAISGTVGAVVTGAFGEAVSSASYGICKAEFKGDTEGAADMIKNFAGIVTDLVKQNVKANKKPDDYELEE